MTSDTTEECLSWLKAWVFRNEDEIRDIAEDQNYFEQGLVDSFGLMELIVAVENQFSIKFLEKHYQDERFSTLKGLAEIIQELQSDLK